MQIVFLAALVITSIINSKLIINDDYCDKKQTNAVKGICIGLVFLSHSNGYLDYGNTIYDRIYSIPFYLIGQLMVVMFLFYSGYGIAVQYQKQSEKYLKHFFYKRIVKTELHFALGVLIFFLLNIVLGTQKSLYETALSFIGWTTIGNSNWYIFDILLLYFATYTTFKVAKKRLHIITGIWIASFLAWIFLYITKGKDQWWYDTLLTYPLGFTFAFLKPELDKKINDNKHWLISMAGVMVCFIVLYVLRYPIPQTLCSLLFAALVILLTKRLLLGNAVLYWLGTRLFEIYLFQRIPMIILSHYGINRPLIFIGISIIVTFIIAEGMHRLYGIIDNKLDTIIIHNDEKHHLITN